MYHDDSYTSHNNQLIHSLSIQLDATVVTRSATVRIAEHVESYRSPQKICIYNPRIGNCKFAHRACYTKHVNFSSGPRSIHSPW
jgi:hypothetical protein